MNYRKHKKLLARIEIEQKGKPKSLFSKKETRNIIAMRDPSTIVIAEPIIKERRVKSPNEPSLNHFNN